jgi:hypothetical protein
MLHHLSKGYEASGEKQGHAEEGRKDIANITPQEQNLDNLRATLWDALPEEYKEKVKQQAAEESLRARYGSEQATEFADAGEMGNNLQDPNLECKNKKRGG